MVKFFCCCVGVLLLGMLVAGNAQAREGAINLSNLSHLVPYETSKLGVEGLELVYQDREGNGTYPNVLAPGAQSRIVLDNGGGWVRYQVWDEDRTVQYGELTLVVHNSDIYPPVVGISCAAAYYKPLWDTASDWPPEPLIRTLDPASIPGACESISRCAYPHGGTAPESCVAAYLYKDPSGDDLVEADIEFYTPGRVDRAYNGDMCLQDKYPSPWADTGDTELEVNFCCSFYIHDAEDSNMNRPYNTSWFHRPDWGFDDYIKCQ